MDEAEKVGDGVKVVVFLFLRLFSLSVRALWCARVVFRSLPPLIHFLHIFSLLSFSLILPHTVSSLSLSLFSWERAFPPGREPDGSCVGSGHPYW